MFDQDIWQEIFSAIRKNKLRTFLTGFSVAWGIFILMVLLGSGNGLSKGVMHNFSDAKNSVWMWGGSTSMPYQGLNAGRAIEFKNDDLAMIDTRFNGIENLSGRLRIHNFNVVNYKNKYGDFDLQAIHPGHQVTETLELMEGRLLNKLDIEKYRKVAIIGRKMKEQLFGEKDPIGEYIQVGSISFQVVGVFNDIHESETERFYIPITIAQKTFADKNKIGLITFTTGDASLAESEALIADVKNSIARKHKFDVEDTRAMGSWNASKEYQQMSTIFKGIQVFVGVIGIFTIIAGIVGVSNIMLIVVKERTKEIGVRKAIGATPRSIIGLIILEALIITSAAGYIGLISGVLVLESFAKMMPASDFFRNPGVDFNVAIQATLLIIISGVLAGYVPARKAARIKPIEALRDE